ncbi:MAG: hypothetical protein LC650_04090, partial [Actinobacteria bacterium]|nr:hypothetical protein [Actinomycetota bacterium]
FEKFEDFNTDTLEQVALSIKNFAEIIGREDLRALADIFSHSVLLHTGGGDRRPSPASPIPEPEPMEDGFVYRDGTVVHLDPEDNVYATVNDLHYNEINAGGGAPGSGGYSGEPVTVDVNMPDMGSFLEDNVSTLEHLSQVISDLQSTLKTMMDAKNEGQSEAPTIISINQGYRTQNLLEPSV